MKKFMGLIRFKHSIFCNGETMGKCFDSAIGGVTIKVYLPDLIVDKGDDDKYSYNIKEPVVSIYKKFNDWGYVRQWNINSPDLKTVGVEVKAVVFVCEVVESEVKDKLELLSKGINLWRAQFYEYCFLYGKPVDDINEDDFGEKEGVATNVDLIDVDDNVRVNMNSGIIIKCRLRDITEFFTMDELVKVFANLNINKRLCLEYEMFLNALVEMQKENYRYAIMEATTAVELCVTKRIMDECDKLNIDGKGLCDVFYRSLGNRFDLLKVLGINFVSTNPSKDIVKPRNDLFHNRNLQPDYYECKKVLDVVKVYLDEYIKDMYL